MNIEALINSNANVSVMVSVADLKEFAVSVVNETIAVQKDAHVEESYLSPDDVSQMIGVSNLNYS